MTIYRFLQFISDNSRIKYDNPGVISENFIMVSKAGFLKSI